MKRFVPFALACSLVWLMWDNDAAGRGFGGGFSRSYSGSFSGSRSFGGYSGSFSGSRSFGGYGGGSYSASRSVGGYSGWDRGAASGSYDRSYSGSRGGSINTEGTRGVAYGPYGAAAGGRRETTVTGPEGRSYSGESQRGAAVGPYGRTVGGSSGYRTASGPGGTVSRGWEGAFAGTRFPSDAGLAHYSSFGTVGAAHTTAYWSHGYTASRAGTVRTGFGYYNAFRPNWYTAHPGAWHAAGWTAGAAWQTTNWAALTAYCGLAAGGYSSAPVDYGYGDTVVYQENNVYENGQQVATADQYAQQATTLAEQGQKSEAPAKVDWKALGVFALVSGDEKTSNNIFQLAIDKDGIIRGNYYDGLMDTTTPVYGSVDKKTQRAAWTIGKKTDRVFDAGLYNLTQEQTPVLVHFGKDKTQQWLLVRMEQPKDGM